MKIRYEIVNASANPLMSDMPWGSHHYRVRFRRGNRQLTTPFSCGPALGFPNPGEVLECLLSDALLANGCRDFSDFCCELGYDPDSRRAEQVYNACKKLAPKVENLLGDAIIRKAIEADDRALFLQNQCLESESSLGLE
jgi:hypothetical protein